MHLITQIGWSMNTNAQKTCAMDNLQWMVHVRYAVHGPRAPRACIYKKIFIAHAFCKELFRVYVLIHQLFYESWLATFSEAEYRLQMSNFRQIFTHFACTDRTSHGAVLESLIA